MEKEQSLSSLMRTKPVATKPKKPAGKKIPLAVGKMALGKKKQTFEESSGDARSKANPAIVLIDKQAPPALTRRQDPPPPPTSRVRRPSGRSSGGAADASGTAQASCDADLTSASPSEAIQEEMEDDDPMDEEYSDDIMFEDDPLGLSRGTDEVEQDTVVVSSDEGNERGQKCKKGKGVKVEGVKVKSRENAVCWRVFTKQPCEEGGSLEGELRAICKHCAKEYKYVQGSSTSTLNRHMKKCQKFKNNPARLRRQTRLGFQAANATSGCSDPILVPPGYDHATMKLRPC